MTNLEAALQLAKERGWHVFPCCAWDQPRNAPPDKRGKAPLVDSGFKAATTDETQIRRWWSQWPEANIGIACGASGIVVVDVDGPEGWRQLEYGSYDLPETLTSQTGKPQGKHFIYAAGSYGIRSMIKIFGKQTDKEGVDVRADGGYIIAPPSKHYSGKLYEFEDDTIELAPVPLWLVGHQQAKSGDLSDARKLLADADAKIFQSERNTTLHRIGCVYRRDNFIQDAGIMYAMLMAENQRRCEPPLDAGEVRKIAEQAVKVLADEVDLTAPGWDDAWVKAFAATGDAGLAAQANALLTKAKDRMPDFAKGELSVDLVRHTVPGSPGGTFAVTVQYKGQEAVLHGVTGDDLTDIARLRGRCIAEKLLIPKLKQKRWDGILGDALNQCIDIEVPPDVSVTGACADAILEVVADLTDTTEWADFPKGKDRYRFNHGDGSYSAHSGYVRQSLKRMVWDAKRNHVTEAMRSINAIMHKAGNGKCRMVRVRLDEKDAN